MTITDNRASIRIKVRSVAYHRNGVSGEGFHVVLFHYKKRDMVATVFDSLGQVAVLDLGMAAGGEIRAGINSWRGDEFEKSLREAIRKHQEMGHA